MDKAGGSLCYIPDRTCKLIVSTAILHNFCMNHGLSVEYDDSDQEMSMELVEIDSIGNVVLVGQEIIVNYLN